MALVPDKMTIAETSPRNVRRELDCEAVSLGIKDLMRDC